MNDSIVREDLVKYELMVIIRPDLAMDAISARLDEIRKLLKAGEIFFEDIWGMRNMAYRIRKFDRGFYAIFDFVADPSLIKDLEHTLNLEPEVVRHMIVKLPFSYEPKSFAVIEEEKAPVAEKDARPARRKVARPAAAEKAAEPKAEEKPAEPRKKETTLEDVDAKLKSIIENPDINF